MKIFKFLRINLKLFDGEGGALSAPATATSEATAQTSRKKGGKSGDLSHVLYGKAAQAVISEAQDNGQAAADETKTDVKVTSNTLDERKKAYNDLIRGEYADLYQQETQRMIDKRFKETKNLEKQVNDVRPLLDMLSSRYNISDGDIGKLTKAIDEDTSYWTQAADEAGMSVEQYKEFMRLQRENKAFREAQREQEAQRAQADARTKAEGWYNEAQAVKEKFPDFDFSAEIENPRFMALLNAGTPVEHAYKMMHMDEIMAQAVNTTSIETEKKVVGNIRAQGLRPAENGASSQSGFTVKTDVSKLTKKDRAELARRAKMGEHTEF